MDHEDTKESSNPRGRWFFIALEPEIAFLLLDIIEHTMKRKKIPPKIKEKLIILHYIVEGACSSALDTSSED
jgi:hypothetical protein